MAIIPDDDAEPIVVEGSGYRYTGARKDETAGSLEITNADAVVSVVDISKLTKDKLPRLIVTFDDGQVFRIIDTLKHFNQTHDISGAKFDAKIPSKSYMAAVSAAKDLKPKKSLPEPKPKDPNDEGIIGFAPLDP